MEFYKIKVLGGDEIDDLISDLLELALEMKDVDDIRVLIRLAQILHQAESLAPLPTRR